MDRKKLHKDNTGMTLLEVIVAVSIFSITAIVLLQSFVTSSRINKKSNLYLEATTVAQNIMEEIKAKKFAEVSLAFNYPLDSYGSSRLTFLDTQKNRINSGTADELGIREVLAAKDNSNSVVYNSVRKYTDGVDKSNVTASVISTDNGKTYKFNPRNTGDNESKYYFELTNVNNNHETFDALVTFDGSQSSGYKKKTTTNSEEGKNDYLTPNISKLDTKSNAFLIMPQTWDENAMQQLVNAQEVNAKAKWEEQEKQDIVQGAEESKEDYEQRKAEYEASHPQPQRLDWKDVYKNTRRTLYIKIEENNGTIKAKAKYTLCAYNYKKEGGSTYETMSFCPCNGTGEESDNIKEGCFCTYKSAYVPFYSSETGESLKNLFVFYYPNYNSKSSTNPYDKIVLDNTTNYEVNFYVTKQRDEANQIPSYAQETMYRMSLTILENPAARGKSNWNTNPSLYRAVTKLRTNLDYNISDMDEILKRPKISQMSLTYQAVNDSGNNGAKVSNNAAKKILEYNGLDDREEEDRIYTVKVEVYKAGAAAKNFQGEKPIATLDGSKEN
ncbi:type IV pilus modification PilV family protein [Blautia sp. HCP3S3_C4]|uniref:type IV pilus modification PilV family protein n=1 Tax=Blautia sp. HCP3S3_C4 TaxID=3438911 RepID=UPI003F8C04CD